MVYIKPRETEANNSIHLKISFVQTLTCFCDETHHSMTVTEAWLTKPTDAMSNRFEML